MEDRHSAFAQRIHKNSSYHHHSPKMPKSKIIVVYTVVVCLSCLYLQTQHFQYLLGDTKAHYIAILTYIDVFMCLWSYFQTIRIGNLVPKLKKLEQIPAPFDKFYDYEYSPTHKQCTTCDNYKLPRVHHCNTCGSCQYKMDHHCIWTQTCIGFRNQKCFYLFCFYMTIGVMQFWYFTFRVIRQKTVPFFKLMEPGAMILWGFTAFSAFFVGIMIVVLFISHTMMILTNHGTLDSMKRKQICPMPFCQRGSTPDKTNLFDRGELQNFKMLFGPHWWLWAIPTAREPENEIISQPMAPHPDTLSLMRSTNLYEVQLKYKQEMKRLPNLNFLAYFLGKRMKINGEVFLIGREKQKQQRVIV